MEELRIILFDEVGSTKEPFAAPFERVDGVTVVGCFDSWEAVRDCFLRNETDIVAFNLDGKTAIEIVQKTAKQFADRGIIGISQNTNASFIIQAMRCGCGQFVCAPVDQEDLNNAVQRVRPARAVSAIASRRVCIVGSSGGAGATTLACNLSMELSHHTGEKIALVDMNLEYGDVACSFDCTPKYTVADICGEGVDTDPDTLSVVLHELPCGVSIIARPEQVDESRDVAPDGVDRMFRMLGQSYPFVVVDLPRSYNFLSAVVVNRADFVLITTQLGVPFIRNAKRVYDVLLQMGTNPDNIQIVINRFNAEFERITIKDVEQHFRRPVFTVIPNDYQYVSASLDLGHPIGADAPSSKCRAAIQELARKLAPEYAADANDRAHGAGLLSKWLGRKQKLSR